MSVDLLVLSGQIQQMTYRAQFFKINDVVS